MKKLDVSGIKKRLAARKVEKVKTSVYVDTNLWDDFKEACADNSTSTVLEELMRIFVESEGSKRSRR